MIAEYKGKVYVFNGDYEFTKTSLKYYNPVNGILSFDIDEEINKKRRRHINCFSTRFAHTGVILENDPRNLETGLHRLFACRVPTKTDGTNETDPLKIYSYEQELRSNMNVQLNLNGIRWANATRQQSGDMPFELDRESAISVVCQMPHSKQKMRMNTYLNAQKDGSIVTLNVGSKYVDVKCKYPEIAKPGKNIRLIIDCRIGRSLVGSLYMSSLKHHIGDKVYKYGSCNFIFITGPKTDVMIQYFHTLASRNGEKWLVVFSDDACFSDGHNFGNADISSCDVTHMDSHFDWCAYMHQFPQFLIDHLTEQQFTTHCVTNPHNTKQKIKFKPRRRKQQSGSTFTTDWNVELWRMIANYWGENNVDLVQAARNCGVVITIEIAKKFGDLQFLKFSPVIDITGTWRAVMNPGVLFRMSGRMKNDLPIKYKNKRIWSIQERCNLAQSQLVNGYLQYFACKELEVLKICKEVDDIMTDDFKIKDIQSGNHKFTLESLMDRYDASTYEIAQLAEQLSLCTPNTVVYNPLVGKVLQKDYGITTPLLA